MLSPRVKLTRCSFLLTPKLGHPNILQMIESCKSVEDLSLAQQRYVERIDELCRVNGHAHTSDLASGLGVSMPSVTEAVSRLSERGVAIRRPGHEIVLTEHGARIAEQLSRRHLALRRFMTEVMAMEPERADQVACRVEHCVDADFAERLSRMAELLEAEYPWALKGIAQAARESESAHTAVNVFQI